jgi:hypothetical protein
VIHIQQQLVIYSGKDCNKENSQLIKENYRCLEQNWIRLRYIDVAMPEQYLYLNLSAISKQKFQKESRQNFRCELSRWQNRHFPISSFTCSCDLCENTIPDKKKFCVEWLIKTEVQTTIIKYSILYTISKLIIAARNSTPLSHSYVCHLFYTWSFLLSAPLNSLTPQSNFPQLTPRHHVKHSYVIMSSKDSIRRSTGF